MKVSAKESSQCPGDWLLFSGAKLLGAAHYSVERGAWVFEPHETGLTTAEMLGIAGAMDGIAKRARQDF